MTITSGSTDFQRGEQLIRSVYDALRANPKLFRGTVLVITYDEHGGLYDHVTPPRTPHPTVLHPLRRPLEFTGRLVAWFLEVRRAPFDFTSLGLRVPTVIISPWIAPGTVESTLYDHTSVIATLRAVFAPQAPPLTRRDAKANTFHHLVADQPTPRTMPELPPDPPAGGAGQPLVSPGAALPVPPAAVTLDGDLLAQLQVLAPKVEQKLNQVQSKTPDGGHSRRPVASGTLSAAPDTGQRVLQYAHEQRHRPK
jgi:phospholipase C